MKFELKATRYEAPDGSRVIHMPFDGHQYVVHSYYKPKDHYSTTHRRPDRANSVTGQMDRASEMTVGAIEPGMFQYLWDRAVDGR